jgi:predicted nucleic acid-binding protein
LTVTATDTSVIVAALLGWHEFHRPALDALLGSVSDRRDRLVLPSPALVEAYSVMTRLPAPHRLAPADAIELLSGSFETRATLIGLAGKETWRFLHLAAGRGVAGGRAYDALILQCALKGGATRLLTLDRRDFEHLSVPGLEIVVP